MAAPTDVTAVPANIGILLETHCVSCHGPKKSKGKITLHDLDGGLAAGRDLARWEKILKELRSGEMPPEDEKQPTDAERKALIAWIEAGMRNFASTAVKTDTAPTARRLTNFEYQNTMRDLLGFELKLSDNLPEDPVKPYRFNNTADFMLIGPEQMDRYLECARRAMTSAIVDPGKPVIHRAEGKWTTKVPSAASMNSDEIGVYRGAGLRSASQGLDLKSWPKTGEFRIRFKASAVLPPGVDSVPLQMVMGYPPGPFAVFLLEPVGNLRLTNNTDNPQMFEMRGRIENFPVRPPMSLKKGISPPALCVKPLNLYDDGHLNDHTDNSGSWDLCAPRVVVESIEFEAPIADVWPPEHHTRILFESPLRETNKEAYVKEVLKRFMSRAYRRPVTVAELDQFVKVYNILAGDSTTLEDAMRETLALVLTTPQFLYHTTVQNGVVMRPYELASKLSYFLWGSMPDETLLALATQGKLEDPAVIEAQVRRMLADKRSGDFVKNFTMQWLSIEKAKTRNINQQLFPRFLFIAGGEAKGREVPNRPTIRDYMEDETIGFIAELIKKNASITNLVDSNFAFVNQPLAGHYGIAGVQGNELRAVPIKPEHHLGGLLTQGSVLVANSTGSAPHPIYRAVWLREAILGEDVKPPPAEVPALADSAGEAATKAITIKDLLREHRKKESCNVCHASLDPWGIPFEKYNAIGKFQPMVPKPSTRVRGFIEKIDKDLSGYEAYLKTINTEVVHADARLPRGPEVDGMEQLKAFLLKERKDDIAENVLRRLLTYSIGRSLTAQDSFQVEQLRSQTRKNDYRFQDMIIAICQSEAFLGQPRL
ncbi:MAG: DUF1592 domain-containing protein [Verrucomicrobia bacterium]|nr:DUF1592 domain-containing protein [Verrucomicrobiota bacterium]